MAATIDPRLARDMKPPKWEITCTVQIGNSDDKLPQREWVSFIRTVHMLLNHILLGDNGQMHFFGTAPADSEYQNACWVFVVWHPAILQQAKEAMALTAERFHQASIAFTTGSTELVGPGARKGEGNGNPTREVRT